MPDREKVIKALEFCTSPKIVYTCYGECPYAVADDEYKCTEMKRDALALLKEQEAVEPINSYGTFRCGKCRNIVGYNDGHGRGYQNKFCSECGQAVKWDG